MERVLEAMCEGSQSRAAHFVVLAQPLLEPQRLHLFEDLLVALPDQVGIGLDVVVYLRVFLLS
jgi:hypothetical protein